MNSTLLVRPCIIIASDCTGCSTEMKKKKCCKKYKKKGKTNCKRCPNM